MLPHRCISGLGFTLGAEPVPQQLVTGPGWGFTQSPASGTSYFSETSFSKGLPGRHLLKIKCSIAIRIFILPVYKRRCSFIEALGESRLAARSGHIRMRTRPQARFCPRPMRLSPSAAGRCHASFLALTEPWLHENGRTEPSLLIMVVLWSTPNFQILNVTFIYTAVHPGWDSPTWRRPLGQWVAVASGMTHLRRLLPFRCPHHPPEPPL